MQFPTLPPVWKPLLAALSLATLPAHAHPPAAMMALAVPLAEETSGRWVVVSNHNHTKESHDSHLTISQLVQQARREGIEALVLTDHNSVNYYYDPAFREPQPVTLIGGEEWSSDHGHAGLIGLEGGRPLKGAMAVDRMLAETRARHGVAIVNHPFLMNLSWRSKTLEAGVDGVEVWNNYWGTPLMGNQKALDWWQQALARGRHLTAVGGGDYHGHLMSALARPLNLVWARDASAEAIVEGFRSGRVVVVSGSHAPRVDLAVEGTHIGETLKLPAPQEASIRVRVQGGRGKTVSVMGPDGLIARRWVDGSDVTYEVRTHLSGNTFVRAELRSEDTVFRPMLALTNPVWIETGPEVLTAGR